MAKQQEQIPLLVSARSVQRTIGYGSILLPFMLLLGVLLPLRKDDYFQPTMSEFVYTASAPIFIGGVFSLGIIFLSYRGFPGRPKGSLFTDRQLAVISGLSCFLVATFPSPTCVLVDGFPQTRNMFDIHIAGTLHFTGAALLYGAMAWFCLFHFTQSDQKTLPSAKKRRNRIYRAMGLIIVAGLAILAANKTLVKTMLCANFMLGSNLSIVFYIEAIMTIAFAFAWLVKSGDFFADPSTHEQSKLMRTLRSNG